MESSITCACNASERIIARAGSYVRGDLWSRCAASSRRARCALVCGVLPCIARCSLHEMYGVSILDLDAGERIWVLQHAPGIYQALSLWRDVCIFGGGELGFEISNCGGRRQRKDVLLIVGRLDVEGDLGFLGGRGGGVVGHDASLLWARRGSDEVCGARVAGRNSGGELWRLQREGGQTGVFAQESTPGDLSS